MKVFKDVFTYSNHRCDVHYVETDNLEDIPDELIIKAHAVCFWNDKMLLVNHPQWNIWGIPGGTREEGESVEDALIREILEETNCDVINLVPIAYQKVISSDGGFHYRAQYMCVVEPVGAFERDVAGNINKILWINPHDYKDYIEKKEFKEVVVRRAIELYEREV